MLERLTYHCDPDKLAAEDYPSPDVPAEIPGDYATKPANVVSSLLPNGWHAPVIDIDVPVAVVPSSTPGHFHLYIDRELSWDDYERLLRAMVDAGVVQRAFYERSLERGKSLVRMPWVNKAPQLSDREAPKPFDFEIEEPF